MALFQRTIDFLDPLGEFVLLSPLGISGKDKFILTRGVAMWVALVLFVFRPFGLFNFSGKYFFMAILGLVSINTGMVAVNLVILPRLLFTWFEPHHWTLRKGIIWLLYLNSSNAFANLFFVARMSRMVTLNWYFIVRAETITAAFILVPFVITILRFQNNKYSRLSNEDNMNSNEAKERKVVIVDEKNRPALSIDTEQLLIIAAAQNYVEIIWQKDEQLKKMLLRNRLKRVEQLLQKYPMFVRCHRAYIVNLQKVVKLKRTGHSYYLVLAERSRQIPVSRRYLDEIKQRLNAT